MIFLQISCSPAPEAVQARGLLFVAVADMAIATASLWNQWTHQDRLSRMTPCS